MSITDFHSEFLKEQIGPDACRYAVVHIHYCDLVDYGWAFMRHQANRDASERELWLDRLMAKLLAHATTLRHILPSRWPETHERLWDTSAWCAITRAVIEVHDAIEYLCVHAVTDEDLLFRLQIWELHSLEQELRFTRMPGETLRDRGETQQAADQLRKVVMGHQLFNALDTSLIGRINKGDTPMFIVPLNKRNELSGIDPEVYKGIQAYLSSHLHSHPAALAELEYVRAGEPSGYIVATRVVRYACSFVARAINTTLSTTAASIEPLPPPPGVATVLHEWPKFTG